MGGVGNGGRGRLALGFKPRHRSWAVFFLGGDHAAWAEKNHGHLFLFLKYGTLDWERGKEGVCICGCSKGFGDLNEDIKLLLLSLYNSLNK